MDRHISRNPWTNAAVPLALSLVSCASSTTKAPSETKPQSQPGWVNIATIPARAPELEEKLAELLATNGIAMYSHGSKATAIAVEPRFAILARQLLIDHAIEFPRVTVWPLDAVEEQLRQR